MNDKNPSVRNIQHLHQGQSLVEFAIILPVLLLVILGAMDFARLFTTKIVLNNAAREGANYLSQNPAESGNLSAVIASEADNLTDLIISSGCSGSCKAGDKATVTITKDVILIFGGFLKTFGITDGSIQLSSTVEMMVR